MNLIFLYTMYASKFFIKFYYASQKLISWAKKRFVAFQVYYKFNNLALLMEPFLLISGFLFLFIACIVYMHTDASISKFSASYLAKQQLDEVFESRYLMVLIQYIFACSWHSLLVFLSCLTTKYTGLHSSNFFQSLHWP